MTGNITKREDLDRAFISLPAPRGHPGRSPFPRTTSSANDFRAQLSRFDEEVSETHTHTRPNPHSARSPDGTNAPRTCATTSRSPKLSGRSPRGRAARPRSCASAGSALSAGTSCRCRALRTSPARAVSSHGILTSFPAPPPPPRRKERNLENLAGGDVVLTEDEKTEIAYILDAHPVRGGRAGKGEDALLWG